MLSSKIVAHDVLDFHHARHFVMIHDTEQSPRSEEIPPPTMSIHASHVQDPLATLVHGDGAEDRNPVGLFHHNRSELVLHIAHGSSKLGDSLDAPRADNVGGRKADETLR